MERPIIKKMNTIQRSAPGSSAWFSHFKMAQKTMAVKKEDNAYTSPSTALYQKESLKVYANAPTIPAPMILHNCAPLMVSVVLTLTILRAKWVMVQNKNKMVNPLAKALITFTAFAAAMGLSPKSIMNMRPNITNKGAPGGCGICRRKQLLTNSPQSQRLPPASAVKIYTVQAMKHTTQPTRLLIRVNCILVLVFKDWQTYLINAKIENGSLRISFFKKMLVTVAKSAIFRNHKKN